LLREDNAALRLMETGHKLGLINDDMIKEVKEIKKQIGVEINRIKSTIIKPSEKNNQYLRSRGTKPINTGIYLDHLLKRAELDYEAVERLSKKPNTVCKQAARQVEIQIKYEGYIKKQLKEIEKLKSLEEVSIPAAFDYNDIHGLSNELKDKLSSVKPTTLGQASRIDGITPAALSVLMISLKAHANKQRHPPKPF